MKVNFTILLLLVTFAGFSQDSWKQQSSLTNNPRYGAFYFSIGDRGYFGTGSDDSGPFKSDFWVYDPLYNVWTQKADFGGGIRAYGTGFSIGDKGYAGTGVVGSYSWTQDMWEYDTAANAWTIQDNFPGGLRYSMASFSIGNKGYVGTGEYRESPWVNSTYYNDFWEFDPGELPGNQWQPKKNVPQQGRTHATGMSIGNKGYIGFGVYYYDTRKSDLWEYDPSLDAWTEKASLPAVGRYKPALFSIGNKGYVVGGQYYSPLKDFWEFDPSAPGASAWTQKDDFPGEGRSFGVGMTIGNKGYVGFGTNGVIPLNDWWEYRTYPVTISCPEDTIVSASTGCATVVNGLDPVYSPAGENPLLLYQIIYNGSMVSSGFGSVSGKTFSLGTSYVYYQLPNWEQQCGFTVTVVDDPPVLDCPGDTSFCKNESNTYLINELVATDICGIAETTYNITGATTRNGAGNNASGIFNPGVSLVVWTVKDINNNTSTCSTEVTVNVSTLSSVSIQTSGPEDYCYNFVLNAIPTPAGTYTYLWNTGETTPIKVLDNSLPDGVYTVSVTDQYGCVTKTASYNYQKQKLFSSYTLLGLKTVYLGERNAVGFGSVGVTGPYGLASIGPNSFVAAPGSFVNAKFIRVAPSAVVFTKIYAPALVTLPVMQYNTRNVSGLPIINVPANTTTTLNGNYRYLNVGKGAHVTLNGNLFGDIRLAEGGELIFNSASIDIRSLTMDNGTLSARTTANFNANSRISVRVSDKVVIGEHCRVSGSNMVFYIGDKRTDIERFSVRARDTHVEANVFIPNGILLVSGNNAPGTECVMTGYFIADVIVSLGREVLWNPRFCNVPLPLTVNNEITGQRTEGELEVQKSIAGSPMKISVYPNPSAQYFNMVIQSEKADQLQVSIYDVSGRKIEQINGPSNKTYTFGYQYRPGIYLVEVQRGKEKNTIKVVKL